MCPICYRDLLPSGPSVDRHHLIPRSQGGKEQILMHKICHRKLHSLFTEKELAREYNTVEKIRSHPEVIKFINWIRKKPIDYMDQNITANRKRY